MRVSHGREGRRNSTDPPTPEFIGSTPATVALQLSGHSRGMDQRPIQDLDLINVAALEPGVNENEERAMLTEVMIARIFMNHFGDLAASFARVDAKAAIRALDSIEHA